jgi:hypothetical protein
MGTSMSICLFGKFEISTQHTERASSDADIEGVGGRGGRFAPLPPPSPAHLLKSYLFTSYMFCMLQCIIPVVKNMLSVGFLLRENQA